MTIPKYYSRLKTLWDELDNYLEIPACTCSAARTYAAQREREKIHQFLMGLGSEYSTVRSNILSHEPAHSLNKVHALILHEEWQNMVVLSHEKCLLVAPWLPGQLGFKAGEGEIEGRICRKEDGGDDDRRATTDGPRQGSFRWASGPSGANWAFQLRRGPSQWAAGPSYTNWAIQLRAESNGQTAGPSGAIGLGQRWAEQIISSFGHGFSEATRFFGTR
ncbi:hypothetical protein CRG98_028580 [Punica granatum]|uniref:Retrotransposon gag domain-containing protein n=1 Tax=Punica granatum TaxID=22663 RepID=A0A2I0J469_PUNGR|nr:hypothetical protein CRG98_028580 [Punica granatum]